MFSKTIIFVSLVSLRSQNCRNLRAFLGVKFSSRVLLRVKELIFRNSAQSFIIVTQMSEVEQPVDVMGYWSEGVPWVTRAHRTPFDAQSFIIVTQKSEVEQSTDVMGYWGEGVPGWEEHVLLSTSRDDNASPSNIHLDRKIYGALIS